MPFWRHGVLRDAFDPIDAKMQGPWGPLLGLWVTFWLLWGPFGRPLGAFWDALGTLWSLWGSFATLWTTSGGFGTRFCRSEGIFFTSVVPFLKRVLWRRVFDSVLDLVFPRETESYIRKT